MRPIKLKIKNLNSFMDEQVIDFEKLTSRGLFGIFGPTGSGKSTILDGITLALYGNIARKSSNFINTNCDKMNVSLEFEIRGADTKRYLIDREFKRNAKGAINAGKCKLVDITNDDDIEVLCDATKALNKKIEEIIGLNLEDFTRTVVLPQGKFSEFLKLEGKERREMLERLFNLQKYGDELSIKLFSEIGKEKQENSILLGELKGYENVSYDILNEKNEKIKEINQNLKELESALKILEEKYKECEELWNLQIELEKYKNQEKELEDKKELIEDYNNKIKLGEAALRVIPYINAFEDTVNRINQNKTELDSLKIKIEEIKNKKNEIEKLYEDAKKEKETEIPSLIIKEQKVSASIDEKKQLDIIVENINKVKIQILSMQNQLNNDEADFKNIEKTYNSQEELITKYEKQYEELKIDEDIKEKIQDGLILEENKENLNLNLKKQDELKLDLEKSLNDIMKKGKDIKANFAKIQDELNDKKILLEDLLKNSPGEAKDVLNLSKIISENEHKWSLYNKYMSQIQEYEKEHKCINEVLKKNMDILNINENELEELKKRFEAANKEELAKVLREELKDGEICPVCGSTHHVKENINSEMKFNSQEINIKIEEKNNRVKEINNEITKNETKVSNLDENIKNIQKEIELLGNEFKEKTIESLKEEYNKLEKSIDEYNSNKEKLQNIVNDLTIKEKEENGNLKSMVSEYRLTEASFKNTQKEIEETKSKLDILNKKLSVIKEETKVDDFKKKNKEIREKEIKRSKLFEEIKRFRNELKLLENNKEILTKQINNASETLAKDKTLLQGLEKNKDEKIDNIIKQVGTIENLDELLAQVKNRIQVINYRFEKQEKEKLALEEEFSRVNEKMIASENNSKELNLRYDDEKTKLEEYIKKENFTDIKDVKINFVKNDILQKYKDEVEKYKEEISKIKGAVSNVSLKINGRSITKEKFDEIFNEKENKNKETKLINEERVRILEEAKNIQIKLDEQKELLEKKKKIDYKLSLLNDLEKLFKGKKFVEFVASQRLKYVSIEASKRLKEITHGTYGLEVDENSKFIIRDYKNGGIARDASTLSGGETFLASLSLALALSAQIQLKGTASLEFFFLDEGFGTLDDELLDVVMSSLERIHNDKLKIGIISHVESIKNRVPVKLIVTPAESGMGGTKTKIEIN